MVSTGVGGDAGVEAAGVAVGRDTGVRCPRARRIAAAASGLRRASADDAGQTSTAVSAAANTAKTASVATSVKRRLLYMSLPACESPPVVRVPLGSSTRRGSMAGSNRWTWSNEAENGGSCGYSARGPQRRSSEPAGA